MQFLATNHCGFCQTKEGQEELDFPHNDDFRKAILTNEITVH